MECAKQLRLLPRIFVAFHTLIVCHILKSISTSVIEHRDVKWCLIRAFILTQVVKNLRLDRPWTQRETLLLKECSDILLSPQMSDSFHHPLREASSLSRSNKYRVPQQDNVQSIRALGTLSLKWNIIISFFPSGFTEVCRRGSRRIDTIYYLVGMEDSQEIVSPRHSKSDAYMISQRWQQHAQSQYCGPSAERGTGQNPSSLTPKLLTIDNFLQGKIRFRAMEPPQRVHKPHYRAGSIPSSRWPTQK